MMPCEHQRFPIQENTHTLINDCTLTTLVALVTSSSPGEKEREVIAIIVGI
jgi:hypothetical protein